MSLKRLEYLKKFHIKNLIDKMNSVEPSLILVEGVNDKRVLQLLGVKHAIMTCSGKSIHEIIDEVLEKGLPVILLMDFDEKGIQLEKSLEKELRDFKVKVDTFFWRELQRVTLGKVREVQDLLRYVGEMSWI